MNKGDKRTRVDKNKTTILVVVSIAAIVTVVSLMVSKTLWDKSNYLGKVADKKEIALKQLEENRVSIESLAEAYESFNKQNPNLLGGSPDGNGPRDGSNGTLVLDALPNRYDFPALASSIEKLLTGYSINGITGSDDTLAQLEAEPGSPVEMPFTFDVATSYDGFKNLIADLNKSIRPFQVVKLELKGASGNLQVILEGKTFYQPESGLKIEQEKVQ